MDLIQYQNSINIEPLMRLNIFALFYYLTSSVLNSPKLNKALKVKTQVLPLLSL